LKSRGIQIESLPSNLILLLFNIFHYPAACVFEWGAIDVQSPGLADWIGKISTLAAVLSYGSVLFLVYFRAEANTNPIDPDQKLILAYIAVVLCILLTAKVFSAQYLVWLCPAILAVDLKRTWELFGLFVASCLLTKLALDSYDAICDMQFKEDLILTARNACLCLMGLATAFKLYAYKSKHHGDERHC